MRRFVLAVVVLAVFAVPVLSASAAGGSGTITPTARQKGGIIRGWAFPGGTKTPARCLRTAISRGNPVLAGLDFNERASGCSRYAFDGTAILWGRGSSWNRLIAGSSIEGDCVSLRRLMGASAWRDLSRYVNGLGC
ncbi:MAG: hypothetical protein WCJ67_03380 [Thermoleophilia bacterium]